MGRKAKRRRASALTKHIENTEAVMLGQPLPHVPKTRFLPLPWVTMQSLRAQPDYMTRALYYDLFRKHSFPHMHNQEVCEAIVKELALVGPLEAPGTHKGLLALGRPRVLALAGVFMEGNKDHYALPKGKYDLSDGELVHRVLEDLRLFDADHRRNFNERPAFLTKEDIDELRKEPDPRARASAKVLRMMKQREKLMPSHRYGIGNNKPGYRARTGGGKYKKTNGHRGTRDGELVCGCLVQYTISKGDYFWVHVVKQPCGSHTKNAHSRRHVRDLKRAS